jgi:2-amino-4-hydroxy-6-hydroxymethyldihydropteridine diphosphokinase
LNAIERIEHNACLIIGSNIRPAYHLPLAIQRLKRFVKILAISDAWETEAVGSSGPKFANAAVLVCTNLNIYRLKFRVLRKIEATLGRQRGYDKYAPRTIDIDIVTYDNELIEPLLWEYPHLAVPCAQVLPTLQNKETGENLESVANRLRIHSEISNYREITSKFNIS